MKGWVHLLGHSADECLCFHPFMHSVLPVFRLLTASSSSAWSNPSRSLQDFVALVSMSGSASFQSCTLSESTQFISWLPLFFQLAESHPSLQS